MVTRQIKNAQTQIEAQNAEIRKNVLKYDEVLNKQRTVIYAERKRVLNGEDLHDQVRHMIDDVIRAYATGAAAEGYAEDWDLEKLWTSLKQLYPIGVTIEDVVDEAGGSEALEAEFLTAQLLEDAHSAYDRREEELGAEAIRELERQVLLAVIDRKWREHLYEMDYLQEGVGLRAYAQRDPLVEYQREGFDMFSQMLEGIKEEAVGYLFNLEVQVQEAGAEVPAPDTGGKFCKHSDRRGVIRVFLEVRLQDSLGDVEPVLVQGHRRLDQARIQARADWRLRRHRPTVAPSDARRYAPP